MRMLNLIFLMLTLSSCDRARTVSPTRTTNSQNAKITRSCLNLGAVVYGVDQQTSAILHPVDYHSDGDPATTQFRMLRGPGAPHLTTLTSPLREAPAIEAAMALAEQVGCEHVRFTDGQTFQVTAGDRHVIAMRNPATGERRRYVSGPEDLTIERETAVDVRPCNNGRAVKRETLLLRLAWGRAANVIRLGEGYARALGLHPVHARLRGRIPVTHGEVFLPPSNFQKKLEDLPAQARSLRCD